jgi:hypothetical protein
MTASSDLSLAVQDLCGVGGLVDRRVIVAASRISALRTPRLSA